MAAVLVALVSLAGCSQGQSAAKPGKAAPTRQACGRGDVLCKTYDNGNRVGIKAVAGGEEITLSPGEMADLPPGGDDLPDAVSRDAEVARIACMHWAHDRLDELEAGLPADADVSPHDLRDAFQAGCEDGAAAMSDKHRHRDDYVGR